MVALVCMRVAVVFLAPLLLQVKALSFQFMFLCFRYPWLLFDILAYFCWFKSLLKKKKETFFQIRFSLSRGELDDVLFLFLILYIC